jgi:hypothetical protein
MKTIIFARHFLFASTLCLGLAIDAIGSNQNSEESRTSTLQMNASSIDLSNLLGRSIDHGHNGLDSHKAFRIIDNKIDIGIYEPQSYIDTLRTKARDFWNDRKEMNFVKCTSSKINIDEGNTPYLVEDEYVVTNLYFINSKRPLILSEIITESKNTEILAPSIIFNGVYAKTPNPIVIYNNSGKGLIKAIGFFPDLENPGHNGILLSGTLDFTTTKGQIIALGSRRIVLDLMDLPNKS